MDVELEARLISQEHRAFHVIKTFYERRKWDEGDPRRDAARAALIWWMLSPTTAGLAIGGLVAVGSLVALLWQNVLIVEQNQFIQQQVQETQRQFEAQRRTQVITYLYEEDGGRPLANARTRAEAFAELLSLERLRVKRLALSQEKNGASTDASQVIILDGARLDGTRLDDTMRLDLSGVFLNQASFRKAELWRLRFNGDGYKGLSFFGANLSAVVFETKTLTDVDFSYADVSAELRVPQCIRCNFEWTLLDAANLQQVQLIEPNFRNAFVGVGTLPPKEFASHEAFAAHVRASGGFPGSWEQFLEARARSQSKVGR